jgi:hypothetical protein
MRPIQHHGNWGLAGLSSWDTGAMPLQKEAAQRRALAVAAESAMREEVCWEERMDSEPGSEAEVASFQRRRVVPVTLSR